jgi:TetR/AcrR family transcriptional repressor of mexJK operon
MREEMSPALRGRPKDPAKREALMDAARLLFVEHGVDAVTMDQIVAAAGVSRATLYGNFVDKGALLEALIARESEQAVSDAWISEGEPADMEALLLLFGEKLIAFMVDPEKLGMERIIAGAAQTFPHLIDRFYAAGCGGARARLRQLIEAADRAGLVRVEDSDQAACDLVGLWQGFLRIETSLGVRPPPTRARVKAQAKHGVRQFLRLYGVRQL